MIRNQLLYLLLTLAMVLFFILYRGRLSLELLIFTLVLPLIQWVMLSVMKHTVRVRLRHSKLPIHRDESYQWVLLIQNTSPFPSPYATAELEYRCSLCDDSQPLRLRVPVLALNTGRVRLSFHAMVCGAMELRVHKLIIYDPLRLFHRTIQVGLADRILISPEPSLDLPTDWEPAFQVDEESVEFSKDKPGDDPSEIFDLHEYRAGDSVSRIHWKLSSKLDSLMVKEYSLPLASAYLLLCDYRMTGRQPDAALRLDAMLSAMQRFSAELTERNVGHRFVTYDPDIGCSESELLTEPDDAEAYMQMILTKQPQPESAKDGFLANVEEYLTEGHSADRVTLFLPRYDEAMLETFAELPKPERFMVIVSCNQADAKRVAETAFPFEVIPAMIRTLSKTPVFLTNDPNENEDEDEEGAF